MLSTSFHKFLRDERGGYTVWSLLWFSLYVAMGGLAVDMTDAYRNQTLLQSTADASALAAVMSLPDQDDGTAQALAYATDNMNPAINGFVLNGAEVIFGNWDFAGRTFTPGTASPDAARVVTRRDEANNNPLGMNFLRILGLWGFPVDHWNISVEAIAVDFVSGCRRGGFVAANKVDVTSGNFFFNDICIHGQNMAEDPGQDYAIDLNIGNEFERRACISEEEPPCGVQVSMPNIEYMNDRSNVYAMNDGLYEAMALGDIFPVDALGDGVRNIIDGLTDPASGHMPDYIDAEMHARTHADGTPVISTIDNKYPGPYEAGHIYIATCNGSKPLSLPAGLTISEVVIIADCNIKASSGLILENVVVASTSLSNGNDPLANNAINLANAARLGAEDFCVTGDGGVEVYALASVHVAANLSMNGLRVVVGGDVKVAAQGNALGVSIQAGNNIIFTAAGNQNGTFGLCPNGTLPPGEYASQYKLVL